MLTFKIPQNPEDMAAGWTDTEQVDPAQLSDNARLLAEACAAAGTTRFNNKAALNALGKPLWDNATEAQRRVYGDSLKNRRKFPVLLRFRQGHDYEKLTATQYIEAEAQRLMARGVDLTTLAPVRK